MYTSFYYGLRIRPFARREGGCRCVARVLRRRCVLLSFAVVFRGRAASSEVFLAGDESIRGRNDSLYLPPFVADTICGRPSEVYLRLGPLSLSSLGPTSSTHTHTHKCVLSGPGHTRPTLLFVGVVLSSTRGGALLSRPPWLKVIWILMCVPVLRFCQEL